MDREKNKDMVLFAETIEKLLNIDSSEPDDGVVIIGKDTDMSESLEENSDGKAGKEKESVRKKDWNYTIKKQEKAQHKVNADNIEELHKNLAMMVETTHEIHNICFDVICKCYGKKEIALPIDIEMVASSLGIKIVYDNLNFMAKEKIDQNIARLCYGVSGGTIVNKIIVDNSKSRKQSGTPLSNLEKYAVAYELGKIIVGKNEDIRPERVRRLNLESRPYSLPRLSARLENFEYEMCAIFLLLPMKLFFDEFQSYINQIKDHPVLMDGWIEHLSIIADIPNYQLINGYQYIKFSAYQYYKSHFSQKVIEGENYRPLYNM